jgi:hypothetical protein
LHSLPPRFWTKRTLPRVESTKLRNILEKELWKYNSEGHVGNGSAMAAAEKEAQTGRPTEGSFHEEKLVGAQNGLQNLLDKNDLTPADRSVANQTLSYVRESLVDFDSAVADHTIKVGSGEGQLDPTRGAQALNRFQANITDSALGDTTTTPIVPESSGTPDGPSIDPGPSDVPIPD